MGHARRPAQAEMARPRPALPEDVGRRADARAAADGHLGPACRPPSAKRRVNSTSRCARCPREEARKSRQQWEHYQTPAAGEKQELATKPPPAGPPAPRSCAASPACPTALHRPQSPPPAGAAALPASSNDVHRRLVRRCNGRRWCVAMRRFGYEGLLLAAIVLLVGFLDPSSDTAPEAPPASSRCRRCPRVLLRLPRLRRGRALFHVVVDRRTADAADEDVAPRPHPCRRPHRRCPHRRPSLSRRLDRPASLRSPPTSALQPAEPRRARGAGSSPSATSGRSSIPIAGSCTTGSPERASSWRHRIAHLPRQRHAHADQHHARDGDGVERLAEQEPRHHGGRRRNEKEEAGATFDAAPCRSSQ